MNNNLPAGLTAAQRQAAIAFNNAVIAQYESYAVPVEQMDPEIQMLVLNCKISLTTLEAKPVGWTDETALTLLNEENFGVMIYPTTERGGDIGVFTTPQYDGQKLPDLEEDQSVFQDGLNALVDCLNDCGDAEQGLRLALRAMRKSYRHTDATVERE